MQDINVFYSVFLLGAKEKKSNSWHLNTSHYFSTPDNDVKGFFTSLNL